jgi:hypothetical protein
MNVHPTLALLYPALNYVPLHASKGPLAMTGADATAVPSTTTVVVSPMYSVLGTVGWVGSMAGMGLGAYHGYKRNHDSVGWGIGWGLLGGALWLPALIIAGVQGFAKPKGGTTATPSGSL